MPPPEELAAGDPCLVAFTSGTSGEPKAVLHGQGYLPGQRLQAEHWLAARDGDLVWCTASSGWSKSARNAFIAPWLRGAAALLHDARFDPAERLEIAEREGVNVLCMAPTEYRVIANRAQPRRIGSLRGLVAAGEALDPDVLGTWHEATGLWIRDGYGQTETGQLTGHAAGRAAAAGLDGPPAARRRARPSSTASSRSTRRPIPTFFLALPRRGAAHRAVAAPATCVRAGRGRLPVLPVAHRRRDRLRGLPDRAVRGRVRARRAPRRRRRGGRRRARRERGAVVRAVVVLRDGHEASDALARELQDHVKAETAPYKYPRIVEFADALPRTASRQGPPRRAAQVGLAGG